MAEKKATKKGEEMAALERSPAVKKMKKRILKRGAEGTYKTYLQRLKRFLEWAKLGADEFLAAVESGEAYPPDMLNSFFDERDDAPKSLKLYAAAVKKLLRVNLSRAGKAGIDWDDLELPKMRTVETDKAPTREVLKRALAESRGIQDRVVPLVALSTGLRVGAIAGLTVGEVDLEEFPDVGVVKVPARLSKTGIAYTTFMTKETKSELIEYLEQRRRGGEEIHGGSPLIASTDGGFYSDPGTLSGRWGRMLDRAGLGEKGRRHRIFHFHTLRKFFRTSLERAGVSKSYRERLLGHSGEYLDISYFDPAFEELLVEYRTAIGELTVYRPEVNGKAAMQAALESMRATAKLYGIDPLTVKIGMEYVRPAEEVKLLRDAITEASAEPRLKLRRGVSYTPEQRVVPEGKLQGYLDDGWKFVSSLNNGSNRVVVER